MIDFFYYDVSLYASLVASSQKQHGRYI